MITKGSKKRTFYSTVNILLLRGKQEYEKRCLEEVDEKYGRFAYKNSRKILFLKRFLSV